jgi:hypothetical protein
MRQSQYTMTTIGNSTAAARRAGMRSTSGTRRGGPQKNDAAV